MMRLPRFRYLAPSTLQEATSMLADAGPEGSVVAGGTDLYPNMKRRQQTPKVVIGLRGVSALNRSPTQTSSGTVLIGANVTLSQAMREPLLLLRYPGLVQAVASISTPHLRNMGTLGGNLCLDTRCNYYDQNHEWRQAINGCMKKDGEVCWVAPGSERCWAVSSSDSAPMIVALSGLLHLASREGQRVVPAADFFFDDGIRYLSKRPEEVLTAIELPLPAGSQGGSRSTRSVYRKLRRRGAFDFPVLSVAVSGKLATNTLGPPVFEEGQIVLGSAGSRPVVATLAIAGLLGQPLSDQAIDKAALDAARVAKPLDNTDYLLGYRKKMAERLVRDALKELRGDEFPLTGAQASAI